MSVARRGGKRDRHPWKSLEEIRKAVCHTYSVQCSDLVTNSITLGTYRQCWPHQVFHSSSSRGPPAGATGETPWMECLCSVLKTEFKERRSQTLGLRKTCQPFPRAVHMVCGTCRGQSSGACVQLCWSAWICGKRKECWEKLLSTSELRMNECYPALAL